MIKRRTYFILFLLTFSFCVLARAEAQVVPDTIPSQGVDTTATPIKVAADTTAEKVDSITQTHSPRKAAIRSAIIPGWGQAYNKRYWKIPIVYGALGTAAGVFVYNVKYYRELRFAVQAKFKAAPQLPGQVADSTDYFRMKPRYRQYDQETLRYYRDEFRRNIDYSVLAFVLLWGLNVVDATVDAHLRSFDVSPDLSFRIKPGYSELGNTHGVSLVLAFK